MSKVEFKQLSPADFFYRNRELAGFDTPAKSLYTAFREIIENSFDGAEINLDCLWYNNNWDTELTWDEESSAYDLDNSSFELISIELDIDNFKSKFKARES